MSFWKGLAQAAGEADARNERKEAEEAQRAFAKEMATTQRGWQVEDREDSQSHAVGMYSLSRKDNLSDMATRRGWDVEDRDIARTDERTRFQTQLEESRRLAILGLRAERAKAGVGDESDESRTDQLWLRGETQGLGEEYDGPVAQILASPGGASQIRAIVNSQRKAGNNITMQDVLNNVDIYGEEALEESFYEEPDWDTFDFSDSDAFEEAFVDLNRPESSGPAIAIDANELGVEPNYEGARFANEQFDTIVLSNANMYLEALGEAQREAGDSDEGAILMEEGARISDLINNYDTSASAQDELRRIITPRIVDQLEGVGPVYEQYLEGPAEPVEAASAEVTQEEAPPADVVNQNLEGLEQQVDSMIQSGASFTITQDMVDAGLFPPEGLGKVINKRKMQEKPAGGPPSNPWGN